MCKGPVKFSSNFVSLRITNDERENEMEDNLTKLGCNIAILKQQTLEINSRLDEQNKTIQDIHKDVKWHHSENFLCFSIDKYTQ